MVQKVQIKRTSTPNSPPVMLDPGELAVEMAIPLRLWVGVPSALDPSGKKLLVPSGLVTIADTPPASPSPGALWWENDSGIMWLWYDDGTSAQWVQAAGGSSGASAVEDIWVNTDGDTMTGMLTVVGGGVQVSGGSIVATRTSGGIWVEANNPYEAFQMTNPSGPAGHGGASTGVDTSGRWVANNTNADYGFAFKAAGTYDILRISNTGVAITPSAGSYSVDARSANYSSGGVIGWATGLGAYGICGSYTNPNVWSFYGDQSAYLSAGTWSGSDARLKTVTGELDRAAALATVNAITVKQFTPRTNHAKTMLYGSGELTGPLFGWIAQEVEPHIPLAVRNVGYPAHDIAARATIKGITIPAEGSPEATTLGEEEDITLKAINDRYMLAQLWAAVQQLSLDNDALRTRVAALEGGA